jgi:prevent-host-death family protein
VTVTVTVIVNVHEAKTHFSKLLVRVVGGEEIVIAKAGKPVARLVPLASVVARRAPGSAAGVLHISDDFDAPLPDSQLAEFEG